jgi:cytochrome c553/cytochrome c5
MKDMLRTAAIHFVVFMFLIAAGGLLVVVTGLVPVKASSGHWPVTRWLLDFSSSRSIATHSVGIKPPDLNQAGLVIKGAATYDLNCRACHGSPSLQAPRVAAAMTPNPPYLPPTLAEWKDAELFYVIKHGIKFTAMPAWPAQQRDDEVWAMVAFLREFPKLDTTGYERLVSGNSSTAREGAPLPDLLGSQIIPRAVTINCARCHGSDGMGRGENAFPRLAAQSSEYIFLSLKAYAGGQRHSGIMGPIAAALSPEEMRELAMYYSRLSKPTRTSTPGNELSIQRGGEIAERGIPSQRVPSCADCHGPGLASQNPNYPKHSGQHAGYLVSQLQLLKEKQRGGTAYVHLMDSVAGNLNRQQMEDVAAYYASLE